MAVYYQKIFRGFLDKSPQYTLPSPTKHSLPELTILKPSVTLVQLDTHGDQLAVVVKGQNLWFCYQISIGGHTEPISACHQCGTTIQFNIQMEDSKIETEEGRVMVVLYSHFHKMPLKELEVRTLQKVNIYVVVAS